FPASLISSPAHCAPALRAHPPAKGGSTSTREIPASDVSAIPVLPSKRNEQRCKTSAMEVPARVEPVKVVDRNCNRSPNVAGTSVPARLVWVQPAASRAAAKKCTSTIILILQWIYDFPGISPGTDSPAHRQSRSTHNAADSD